MNELVQDKLKIPISHVILQNTVFRPLRCFISFQIHPGLRISVMRFVIMNEKKISEGTK